MTRRSFLMAVGILVLLVGISAGALILLVRHEPADYMSSAIAPGPERLQQSKRFKQNFAEMTNAWLSGNERPFEIKMTEAEINSYFAEDFLKSNLDRPLSEHNIRDPRVMLKDDKLSLAFRYGKGLWSSVITIVFNVWLPRQGDPNVIALELQQLKAGSLPISAQSLLKEISRVAQENDIDVSWYRHKGNPVALIRFQATNDQPTMRLERVMIKDGALTIRGRPATTIADNRRAQK